MAVTRRQAISSLISGIGGVSGLAVAGACSAGEQTPAGSTPQMAPPAPVVRRSDGTVDWAAVRSLFPLTREWIHLASFLFVSHPKPVSDAIERFRSKIDADPPWIEEAAFSDAEGRPFTAIKKALAGYCGGLPEEICLTSNTTTALALVYQGLRIRADQEILTTEHDHYSHHESIRLASARSGAAVKYVPLYERAAEAKADDIVQRIARAIGPKTRAVGVTWVHSSTGVKIPIAPIADAVARANRGRAPEDRCLLVVDGVHGFANQDADIAKFGCDFFASGTHKWLFAPRGTGFLWGRADVWPELRPTIPTFDPEAPEPWEAWMERKPLPPTKASFVSPGGFLAYEYFLAIPAAVDLHRTIGRDRIAARVAELNAAFREGASNVKGLTLHTPRSPELSAGISCYELAGMKAEDVTARLAAKKIRTNHSPYKVSLPRVAAGIMNSVEDVDAVLREIRAITP